MSEQDQQSYEDAFDELADSPVEEQLDAFDDLEAPEDEPAQERESLDEPAQEMPDYMAQIEAARQEAAQWQHKYNSDLGRQNALQRKIQELEQENKKLKGSNPDNSGMSDKEWKELKEDFPEIAKAIEAKLNVTSSRYEQEIKRLQEQLQPIQKDAKDRYKQAQYQILEQQHPDWRDVAGSPDFRQWLNGQPPAVQTLFDSTEAADAAYLIRSFKQEVGVQTSSHDEIKQRRERTLKQAQTVPSRGSRTRSTLPPDDDFEAAFDYYATR